MAHIRIVPESDAAGELRRIYDEAIRRAGKVYQVVKLSSLKPEILRPWLALYQSVMLAPSELSRREKEMVAVAVSRANRCHY